MKPTEVVVVSPFGDAVPAYELTQGISFALQGTIECAVWHAVSDSLSACRGLNVPPVQSAGANVGQPIGHARSLLRLLHAPEPARDLWFYTTDRLSAPVGAVTLFAMIVDAAVIEARRGR